MIILNKKRILFIIIAVIISAFVPIINTSNEKTEIVTALPVSNRVIVLDAGHGAPDERC